MIEPEGPDAKRDGLVTLVVLTQRDAQQAGLRTLPRVSAAMRLRDAVVSLMGERLVADIMAGPGNSLLVTTKLRDVGVGWSPEVPGRNLDANHLRGTIKRARRARAQATAANHPFGQ